MLDATDKKELLELHPIEYTQGVIIAYSLPISLLDSSGFNIFHIFASY